jgi:hypothetical protein
MVKIHLTQAGNDLINSIFPEQAALITREMSVLTVAELTELGRLCKKLGTKNGAFTGVPIPLKVE